MSSDHSRLAPAAADAVHLHEESRAVLIVKAQMTILQAGMMALKTTMIERKSRSGKHHSRFAKFSVRASALAEIDNLLSSDDDDDDDDF